MPSGLNSSLHYRLVLPSDHESVLLSVPVEIANRRFERLLLRLASLLFEMNKATLPQEQTREDV